MLVPIISNQDPAPFFLLPPTHHQPFLVLYFVIRQTDRECRPCFLLHSVSSILPSHARWLAARALQTQEECCYTAAGWLWSPEPCPGKAGAPTSFWALLKGTEWALMSHMGNHVGSVQCWSSWPGKRQILPISWWKMPYPLCKRASYIEPLVTPLNLLSSWVPLHQHSITHCKEWKARSPSTNPVSSHWRWGITPVPHQCSTNSFIRKFLLLSNFCLHCCHVNS